MKIPEILLVENFRQPRSLAGVLPVVADERLAIEHLQSLRREQGRTLREITVEIDEQASPDCCATDAVARGHDAGGHRAWDHCREGTQHAGCGGSPIGETSRPRGTSPDPLNLEPQRAVTAITRHRHLSNINCDFRIIQ
jgi:hypothetical protein